MEFPEQTQTIIRRVLTDPQVDPHLAGVQEHHPESYEHLLRVGRLAIYLAHTSSLDETDTLLAAYAGLLHDVGKVKVPSAILKKPGSLDQREYGIIKGHPRLGFLLLRDLQPPEIAEIVVAHHEFQSRSYPRERQRRTLERRQYIAQTPLEQRTKPDRRQQERRSTSERITTLAQIVAAADVYDALSSQRDYKPPLPPETVREIMQRDYSGPVVYIDFLFS